MQAQIILKHQASDAVICELKHDVDNLLQFFELMKRKQGKLEKQFFEELVIDLTDTERPKYSLVSKTGRTTKMNQGTGIGSRTRTAQPQNIDELQAVLRAVKLNIIDDLLKDVRDCFDRRQSNVVKWGDLDIRQFPNTDSLFDNHCLEDIKELAEYYGDSFDVLKVVNGKLCNFRHEAVLEPESLVAEFYSAIKVMRDRFKAGILRRDVHEKRLKLMDTNDGDNTEEEMSDKPNIATSPGINQREAWTEFLSDYREVYPNLAILVRIMMVIITNSADSGNSSVG
jgi:hypothetical protein